MALGHRLKLLTKNGHVYKYDGFQESESEKLSDLFKTHCRLELMEKDLRVKGWNWGTVKFGGQLLSFDTGDQPVFEIPLSNVSQCTTGKNEVTLEFHQNGGAEASLMEVRFYVPAPRRTAWTPRRPRPERAVEGGRDPGHWRPRVHLPGAAASEPRGRCDVRTYPAFLRLRGKTFDDKIPYTTGLRLFLSLHEDRRHMFSVISLDPPIKQGQTRYAFSSSSSRRTRTSL